VKVERSVLTTINEDVILLCMQIYANKFVEYIIHIDIRITKTSELNERDFIIRNIYEDIYRHL